MDTNLNMKWILNRFHQQDRKSRNPHFPSNETINYMSHSVCLFLCPSVSLVCQKCHKLFNHWGSEDKGHMQDKKTDRVTRCCAAHTAEQPEACVPFLLTHKLKTNIFSVCLQYIHYYYMTPCTRQDVCIKWSEMKHKSVPSLFHMSKICLTLWLHTFILKSSVLWSYKALVKVTASLFFCAVLARLQLTYNHASTDSLGFLHIHNSCETKLSNSQSH